jgi:hypothetical protein
MYIVLIIMLFIDFSQKNTLGKVSFTTDLWTDPNMSPFMTVTAHWITRATHQSLPNTFTLNLCSELIGFIRVPQRHTGEHLCEAFMYVLDRLNIKKVSLQ